MILEFQSERLFASAAALLRASYLDEVFFLCRRAPIALPLHSRLAINGLLSEGDRKIRGRREYRAMVEHVRHMTSVISRVAHNMKQNVVTSH
jgi:hypothetical protein